MISVAFKIVDVDYEKTFQMIFPAMKEKLLGLETKDMVLRLFQKLDDAALPMLLGLMERLPEKTKNELLVVGLNSYSGKICDKLKEELMKHSYGKFLDINGISIRNEQEYLYLMINQIEVDYKGLVQEKIPGAFGGVASLFAGERLEKMALKLLWTEESKKKLMDLAQSSLDNYGLIMKLADIQMLQERKEPADVVDMEEGLKLNDDMTETILDALAGYLKDTVNLTIGEIQ